MGARYPLSAAVVSLLLACGGTKDDASGTAGAAGAAGQSGTAGAAGISGSPADFEAIEQCGPSACARSYAQLIEGFMHNVHEESARCVLTALGDRTPGLYVHEAASAWSSGNAGTEHALLVAADGSVLHAKHEYNATIIGRPPTESYSSAERCTLREPAYFQACIDAVNGTSQADDDAAWACLYGETQIPTELGWIHSCSAAVASCD